MKVNIYETVEVSDEQRVEIARALDGDGAKKRQATRDEIKAYIWEHGSGWDRALSDALHDAPPAEEPEDDGMDLI
jgi:hypothetical protein